MIIAMYKVSGSSNTIQKQEVPRTVDTLQDAVALEPDNGVYLVARTWHGGMVLELDAHFDRLESSALALDRIVDVPRRTIRTLLRDLVHRDPASPGDIRFRVTAVLDAEIWYLVSAEPAAPVPEAVRRYGVQCAVLRDAARRNAEVKSTAWMHRRRTYQSAAAAAAAAEAPTSDPAGDGNRGVYEYLLADETGAVLEGGTSNFYAVLDGVLHTADRGVLRGITRKIVLTVAPAVVPVKLDPVNREQLPAIEEAFITSSTRGVVPVRGIDHVVLGAPGRITRRIAEAYDSWLDHHLEPLIPPLPDTREQGTVNR